MSLESLENEKDDNNAYLSKQLDNELESEYKSRIRNLEEKIEKLERIENQKEFYGYSNHNKKTLSNKWANLNDELKNVIIYAGISTIINIILLLYIILD